MGTFDIESPREFIRARIAADPGGDWAVGEVDYTGSDYYFDTRTGSWICVNAYQLLNQAAPYQATVMIAGAAITAAYSIFQTASN